MSNKGPPLYGETIGGPTNMPLWTMFHFRWVFTSKFHRISLFISSTVHNLEEETKKDIEGSNKRHYGLDFYRNGLNRVEWKKGLMMGMMMFV